MERFADTSSVTVTPNTPDWYQTHRDLENLDSGAHADITERSVTDCPTPTGRTLILSSLTWEQTERRLIAHLTPAPWLPPTGEGDQEIVPSSEPLETFSAYMADGKRGNVIGRTTLTMGDS